MLLLAMTLLLSVTLGETNPTREYAKDVTPEERVLKVLQRLGPLEPLAPKLLSHLPMDMPNPWLSAQIPSSSWWWHPEKPETKRRQNLASYNLNSFGLRYGK